MAKTDFTFVISTPKNLYGCIFSEFGGNKISSVLGSPLGIRGADSELYRPGVGLARAGFFRGNRLKFSTYDKGFQKIIWLESLGGGARGPFLAPGLLGLGKPECGSNWVT